MEILAHLKKMLSIAVMRGKPDCERLNEATSRPAVWPAFTESL